MSGSHFALVQFNSDGTLDAAFGKGGKVAVDASGATALALQPDGRIIVSGLRDIASETGDDFVVFRFNSNGSPDKEFGSSGIVTTDFFGSGDLARAVVVQADGRIVVGGGAANPLSGSPHLAVARYDPDGSLDATFDFDGRKTTDLPGFDEGIFGVAVQSDGKALAAGYEFGTNLYDFAVVRYTTSGAEDPSFGTSGVVTTDFFGRNDGIRGVVVQPDGGIVAAGSAQDETTTYFALARYMSATSIPAPQGCAHSPGFWKKHAESWPVGTLTLGSQSYSGAELLRILSSPVKGDTSILLARELIAAKFNIASGASSPGLIADVASADVLLASYAGKLPYNVQPSSSRGRAMVHLAGSLTARNNGSHGGCRAD